MMKSSIILLQLLLVLRFNASQSGWYCYFLLMNIILDVDLIDKFDSCRGGACSGRNNHNVMLSWVSALRERLAGEITLTGAVGSKSDNAEAAVDMNFDTTAVTYRAAGDLWLKLYFEGVSCVQNIFVYWDGIANVILSCPADSTLCKCDTNKGVCDEYQFSVIFERNVNSGNQTDHNCTHGDTLKVDSIDKEYFNLEVEEIAVIGYEGEENLMIYILKRS